MDQDNHKAQLKNLRQLLKQNPDNTVAYQCPRCGMKEDIPLKQIHFVGTLFKRKSEGLPIFLCTMCQKSNVMPVDYPYTDDYDHLVFPKNK